MADGATWEPGHHTCKISTAMGTERPVRPAAATRGLLPRGAERLLSTSTWLWGEGGRWKYQEEEMLKNKKDTPKK